MKTVVGNVIGVVIATGHLAVLPYAAAQTLGCEARSSGVSERVEEARFIPIGGIEQWITIRGDNQHNPVLLHVHGGPGIAFSAFTDEFAPYETDFTVVQWDQRGAGCTFGRYGQEAPELTLDRIARDGIELAEYLERRLPNARIVVLGHSFGSIVATQMVSRAPEHFAAYVGTGQFASFTGTVDAQIAYLRQRAADDPELIAQLDGLRSLDSQSLAKFGSVNRLLASYGPAVDAAFMQRLQSRAAEVMTAKDLADWRAGRGASMGALIPQVNDVDLFATIGGLHVPFFLIQGRDDPNTPTDLAIAFFNRVEAPYKESVIVEGAGHFAHLTHSKEFLVALSRVLALEGVAEHAAAQRE
jgi:pimeloyl-ACP methyl ester carboxylesterase